MVAIMIGLSMNHGLHVVYYYVGGYKYGYHDRESRVKLVVDKTLGSIWHIIVDFDNFRHYFVFFANCYV